MSESNLPPDILCYPSRGFFRYRLTEPRYTQKQDSVVWTVEWEVADGIEEVSAKVAPFMRIPGFRVSRGRVVPPQRKEAGAWVEAVKVSWEGEEALGDRVSPWASEFPKVQFPKGREE